MNLARPLLCLSLLLATGAALADEPYRPQVGQPGKDVVWVPTPPELVEKMLDLARVTPKDYVIDLGSGDGRNVIAAARRGARALGVEYNAEMVAFSQRTAAAEGVARKAKFVQGDMYEADISKATVLALFLLPDNLRRLTPRFLALRPGTRIVLNSFPIPDWEPDQTAKLDDCTSWCVAYLYTVPAQFAGTWRFGDGDGELRLAQKFSEVSGTLTEGGITHPVEGRVSGTRVSFTADGKRYQARIKGKNLVFQ